MMMTVMSECHLTGMRNLVKSGSHVYDRLEFTFKVKPGLIQATKVLYNV